MLAANFTNQINEITVFFIFYFNSLSRVVFIIKVCSNYFLFFQFKIIHFDDKKKICVYATFA